jgi:hypothetical protein
MDTPDDGSLQRSPLQRRQATDVVRIRFAFVVDHVRPFPLMGAVGHAGLPGAFHPIK